MYIYMYQSSCYVWSMITLINRHKCPMKSNFKKEVGIDFIITEKQARNTKSWHESLSLT